MYTYINGSQRHGVQSAVLRFASLSIVFLRQHLATSTFRTTCVNTDCGSSRSLLHNPILNGGDLIIYLLGIERLERHEMQRLSIDTEARYSLAMVTPTSRLAASDPIAADWYGCTESTGVLGLSSLSFNIDQYRVTVFIHNPNKHSNEYFRKSRFLNNWTSIQPKVPNRMAHLDARTEPHPSPQRKRMNTARRSQYAHAMKPHSNMRPSQLPAARNAKLRASFSSHVSKEAETVPHTDRSNPTENNLLPPVTSSIPPRINT